MKALLLAAGWGLRLRPLTDTVPKPLLSVGVDNLIEHNIKMLKNAGVQEIVINVSYRASQIIDGLGDGRRYGVALHYSHEGDRPLGTGGGVFQALTLLGEQPFFVVSADIWSEFPFGERSLELGPNDDARLVFVKNPPYHLKGDYSLTAEGRVGFEAEKLTYAGIGQLHPRLFAHCKPGIFSLSPLLNEAIIQKRVSGQLYEGPWFNVGTLEELERVRAYNLKARSFVSPF